MKTPNVCVVRAAGTNCDKETAFAFSLCQANPVLVHMNALVKKEVRLDDFQILAFPGGFSYGDDIASGKIFANELCYKLADEIAQFIRAGKLIIGICNGFQILVKAGILPGFNNEFIQETTLTLNDSDKYEDRWVYLKSQGHKVTKPHVQCVWTKDLPEIIYLPVAHGEGKFMASSEAVLERLVKNGQVVFQYCDERGILAGYPYNPNGAQRNIAGICDETGRVFGLMPHPERHMQPTQHPRWTQNKEKRQADGLLIFRNGVEYAKTHF